MNLVLVVLWSLAMPYARFRPMASCLSTLWVCVIIVCKMLYQLSVVSPMEYSSNCSLVRRLHTHSVTISRKKKKKTKDLDVFLLTTCPLFSSSQPLANETNLLPEEMRQSALYKEPVDPARWFGIRKDATVLGYSQVTFTEVLQPGVVSVVLL